MFFKTTAKVLLLSLLCIPVKGMKDVESFLTNHQFIAGNLTGVLVVIAIPWVYKKFKNSPNLTPSPSQPNPILPKPFDILSSKKILPQKLSSQDSFEKLAGKIPEELKNIKLLLANKAIYQRIGASIPRGILLVGEPGVGKTKIARALGFEGNFKTFYLSAADLGGKYLYDGVRVLEELIQSTRVPAHPLFSRYPHWFPQQKILIIIDEIESIGSRLTTKYENPTLGKLLEIMTRADCQHITWVGATNCPQNLDPALKRPGRFSLIIHIPLPDEESRTEIFSFHASQGKFLIDNSLKTPDNFANFLALMAQRTAGFSPADIAEIFNIAALQAGTMFVTKERVTATILLADFERAILVIKKMKENQNTNFLARRF